MILHSISSHKEFRFILPILPLVCVLAGNGFHKFLIVLFSSSTPFKTDEEEEKKEETKEHDKNVESKYSAVVVGQHGTVQIAASQKIKTQEENRNLTPTLPHYMSPKLSTPLISLHNPSTITN